MKKATFDTEKGIWTVSLYKKNTAGGNQNFVISSEGNILGIAYGE